MICLIFIEWKCHNHLVTIDKTVNVFYPLILYYFFIRNLGTVKQLSRGVGDSFLKCYSKYLINDARAHEGNIRNYGPVNRL